MSNIFTRSLFAKFISSFLVFAMLLVVIAPGKAMAASVTSAKATFGRIAASTNSDSVVVQFVTPTGIQTGGADTITLTFSADFTVAAENVNNFDIGLGDSGTCSTATYTDETVALTASATEWGVDVTGNVITFSPETDDTLTAGFCIRFEMGTAATTGATGSASTIVNGAADDDDSIVVGGAFADSGTIAVDIIADDQVVITATVAPSITFAISDNTIGFGTLSTSAATWATGDTNGNSSDTVAHTLAVTTNATGGYIVTYNGATLTSGANTIDVASVTDDANGTPGTEQFGVSIATDGDATITSGYAYAGTPDWKWVASTTSTIITETVPTATETFSMHYLANIAGLTQSGSYTTTATYIATGTY